VFDVCVSKDSPCNGTRVPLVYMTVYLIYQMEVSQSVFELQEAWRFTLD
jgi:hypothetical protein